MVRDEEKSREALLAEVRQLRQELARRDEAEPAGGATAKDRELSDQRYQAFLTQSTEGIWRCDLEVPLPTDLPEDEQVDHIYRHAFMADCNDAMAHMYGLAAGADLVGTPLGILLPRSDPHNVAYLTRFIRAGYRLMDAESHEVDQEGRAKFFLNNLVGIVEGGRVVRAWGTQRDVTEQKRAEAELAESRRLFQRIADMTPDVVYLYDLQARRNVYVNREISRSLGYTAERLQAMGASLLPTLVHPDDLPAVQEAIRGLGALGDGDVLGLEYRLRDAAGQWHWVSVRSVVFSRTAEGAPHLLLGLARDVTESRQTEAALREREGRLQAMFDQAGVGISMVDLEGRLLQVNTTLCRLLGYDRAELEGRSFLDVTHPDDREASRRAVEQLLRGERPDFTLEKRYLRRDGSVVWASVAAVAVREGGAPQRMIAVVQDVSDRNAAEAALRALNEALEQRVAERTAELERINARLTTENQERLRAERELEAANAALAQRNRELQDFAHVASHDLQEPLRKIRAFVGLLRAEPAAAGDEAARDYLERMDAAAARMHQLITDLLAFSRVATQQQDVVPVPLGQIVEEVLSDLEISLAETAGRVEVGALCTVEADPLQMRQLFQNLIGNALKFHREGVPPVVRIRADAGPEPGEGPVRCRIQVEDNGIGFEEKYLDRIFAPFQRLHGRSEYPGTGMGLAICRRIAERHGGALTARSTPGKGSTFVITLPVRQPDSHTAHPALLASDRAEPIPGETGT